MKIKKSSRFLNPVLNSHIINGDYESGSFYIEDLLYKKERPRKHRYFYFLGNRKDKKIMTNSLVYKIQKYPKGNNQRYDPSYNQSIQGILF